MTNAISGDQLLSNLSWRYAVKKFDPARKISPKTWKTLEDAIVLSPSSYGIQPWRFYVVDNPETRAKLRVASWDQTQITDASHMVVFARRKVITVADIDAYVARTAEVRKTPIESLAEYKQMMIGSISNPAGLPGGNMDSYARSQVYISLGFFLYTAAMLGVDACPMEGFEPAKYDEILGLAAQGYAATVVATAGYRASDDWLAGLPKVRNEYSQIVTHV